jgi:hypothetical protein
MVYRRNPVLRNEMLPVDIVLGPPWWYHHEGVTFDEDFFYHPARRVEAERRMEDVLYERWGRYGLGEHHGQDLPVVGAVHLAAGYLVSEMMGCRVEYLPDSPPQVKPAYLDTLAVDPEAAFASPAYQRTMQLFDALRTKHGGLVGDINWGGVINVALDLRGAQIFLDMYDQPGPTVRFLGQIAAVMDRFTEEVYAATGSTSITGNRNVRHIADPVFLHCECANVMISTADWERFFMPYDVGWSRRWRPFGIHYCGKDPHRYAQSFAKLPHLDFLDVGWGGDVALLRRHLPDTFLNLRLSPVDIVKQSPEEVRQAVRRLVHESNNPWLTGVCSINMDQNVADEQITAIFEEVEDLRREYAAEEGIRD